MILCVSHFIFGLAKIADIYFLWFIELKGKRVRRLD